MNEHHFLILQTLTVSKPQVLRLRDKVIRLSALEKLPSVCQETAHIEHPP